MHSIFFVGPTLADAMPEPLKGELWLPPAGQGDVLQVFLRYHPRQIILIDGVFRERLAVWVKELVYIMAKGCRFIGASSMGALRAAELCRYGAIGLGKIFEYYRDGGPDESFVACTYDPRTFRVVEPPRCGVEQKKEDALCAIQYARRSVCEKFVTVGLDREKLIPILAPVIDRILRDSLLIQNNKPIET